MILSELIRTGSGSDRVGALKLNLIGSHSEKIFHFTLEISTVPTLINSMFLSCWFDPLNSDGCWKRFQFIETDQTASAGVKTGTIVTAATLNFRRAAQLQNRER